MSKIVLEEDQTPRSVGHLGCCFGRGVTLSTQLIYVIREWSNNNVTALSYMLNLKGTNGFLGKLNQPVKYNSTFIWIGTILTYVSFQSFWDLMSSTGLQNTILKNSFLFIFGELGFEPVTAGLSPLTLPLCLKSTHIWINLESESGWH